jgi:hypothetical protein
MTYQPDIPTLIARVAKAAVDCERWRSSGVHDRYIQAFDDVEALELQLEAAIRSAGTGPADGPCRTGRSREAKPTKDLGVRSYVVNITVT